MNKLLFILVSFFSLQAPLYKDLEDYKIILEERDESEFLYQNGNISLKKENNITILSIGNKNYNYNVLDSKLVEMDDKIYFIYLDHEDLLFDIFNKNGENVESKNEVCSDNIVRFGVEKSDNDIIIFYNKKNNDANDCGLYSISSRNRRSLSTSHNEEVIDVKSDDNYLYVLLKKEPITEGLFGNGGLDKGIVIAKFAGDFRLIDFITMDEEEDNLSKGLSVDGDVISLFKENSFHQFSLELASINRLNIGNNLLITSGFNGDIYVFFSDKIEVYKKKTLNKISSITLDKEFDEVRKEEDKLVISSDTKKYNADIVDIRNIHEYKYLITENLNLYNNRLNSVSSIFGYVTLIKKDYDKFYTAGSYGIYNVSINYKTKGNISFSLNINENYPLECNVKESIIYPSGYRIIFNGSATIDGNSVLSNYQLKEDGTFNLQIEDKKYELKVNHNQKSFSNTPKIVIDDYKELNKNEDFTISYTLNRNLNITNIQSEGLEISSFEVTDKELKIIFDGIRNSGYYFFLLDYFDYEEVIDDVVYSNRYYLKDEYWYHIPKSDITITNISYDEELSYSFNYHDNDDVARYFEFELLNESENFLYSFPLGNTQVSFLGIEPGDYVLKASIVSDIDQEFLSKTDLFTYDVRIRDDYSFGEIKLSKDSNDLYKVKITMDEKFLSGCVNEITYNKNIIYTHQEITKNQVIALSGASLILALVLGFSGRYLYFVIKKKSIIEWYMCYAILIWYGTFLSFKNL